jgi:hypothetical protein
MAESNVKTSSSSKVKSDSPKDAEKVTIYISGDKVNRYKQCSDSDKENVSLKRKKNVENASPPAVNLEKKEEKHSKVVNGSKRMRIDCNTTATLSLSAEAKVINKPPIPPQKAAEMASKAPPKPPIRKKRLMEAETVQKLIAQCEQMRLEISELKVSLASEKNAVRVLR